MRLLFSYPVVSNSLQPHELQHARPMSLTLSQSLPVFTSIPSVTPSSHLILCHPLLLLPLIFPSIRVFSNELDCQYKAVAPKSYFFPGHVWRYIIFHIFAVSWLVPSSSVFCSSLRRIGIRSLYLVEFPCDVFGSGLWIWEFFKLQIQFYY